MGGEVAPVGDYEPTTMAVEYYNNEVNGVNFTIIDTPGLCDDLGEKGNDYDYLELMRSEIDQVDSTWFVTRLDDTRVTRDEKDGIRLISEAFGEEVWEQAIIVFTFAGNVPPEKYRTALKERTRLIREEIAKYADTTVAKQIPSVAVDNTRPTTPDGKRWLNKLYTQVYVRMSTQGSMPFLMSTVHRIKRPESQIVYVPSPDYSYYSAARPNYPEPDWKKEPIELDYDDRRMLGNKILESTAGGAAIGAAVGLFAGPAGAAVGGVIGGVIGLVGGLFAD
jgi:hypothetical protein